MIENEIYNHLKDNVPSLNGRIYPKLMPQDCIKPVAVYGVVSDGDIETLGCVVGSSVRFQIDIYAQSYADVKAIKQEVKTALYSFAYKPQDMLSQDSYEYETKLHREMIDFKVKF